jgi:WXG100 family type VII secretion target
MDFGGVESLALSLTGEAQNNLQQLGSLASKANPDAAWNGDSAQSYRNAFQRYEKAQKDMQEALTALGKAVTTIKQHFQEINQQGASTFSQYFG